MDARRLQIEGYIKEAEALAIEAGYSCTDKKQLRFMVGAIASKAAYLQQKIERLKKGVAELHKNGGLTNDELDAALEDMAQQAGEA